MRYYIIGGLLKLKARLKFVTYTALFAAISIVVNIFEINLGPTVRITFSYTVLFLAGAILGPFGGFLAAAIGDVLGYLLSPNGIYNPIFTLSAGLIAIISGLIFGRRKNVLRATPLVIALKTALSFVIIYVLITVFINSGTLFVFYKHGGEGFMSIDADYFKNSSFGSDFFAYIGARLVAQTIVWAVNLAISALLYVPVFSAYRYSRLRTT